MNQNPSIDRQIDEILDLFQDYIQCEEWHIHSGKEGGLLSESDNTTNHSKWELHKDYDYSQAKEAIKQLIQEALDKRDKTAYLSAAVMLTGDDERAFKEAFDEYKQYDQIPDELSNPTQENK